MRGGMAMTYIERRKRIILFCVIAFIVIVLSAILVATIGAANIGFFNAARLMMSRLPLIGQYIQTDDLPQSYHTIVLNLRVPRILLTLMIGGLLASSGTVYQSVFKNPMADPFILGISSGAALGAAIAIVFGWQSSYLGFSGVSLMAFISALATTFVVYRVANTAGKTPVMTLILTGIAMSFFLSAMLSLLITFNRDRVEAIVFWSYGSFSSAGWRQVGVVFPLFIITTAYYLWKARILNILTLGEESAFSLGVDVQMERKGLLLVASLATAASVAMTGIIGFVGLVVPHMLRLLTGPDNRSLIPYTILGGAWFMLISDTIARWIVAPTEVPIGIITSVIGAPYFVYLIIRNKKGGA